VRVIFMGTPDFAVPTLRAIHQAGHQVVLVVAQPDRPVGRGRKLKSPPTIELARELGLPTSQPRAVRSGSFPARVESLEADVALVIAYGRILVKRVLDAPRLGCLNVHASLLPRWRGAAPIQAAIEAGDAETGVCVQRMVEALDEGPLLIERRTPVGPRETAGELHDRLSELAAAAAVAALEQVEGGTFTPQEGEATYAPKLDKGRGQVHWTEPADVLDRRIRAMSPWPGGWVPWGKGPLKILQAHPVERPLATEHALAGTVLATSPELIVACATGSALALDRVRAPGRKAVSGADFANGARLFIDAPLAPSE